MRVRRDLDRRARGRVDTAVRGRIVARRRSARAAALPLAAWLATAFAAPHLLPLEAQARPVQASAPLSPFAADKAETLLRTKYGCLGCHTLRTEGGQLAPTLHDVATRRDAAYIAAIVTDPQRVRPGAAMPRIRMPATERALIIRYLGGDPATAPTVGTGAPVAEVDGARLYATWCAGCHGAGGGGNGPNAKRLPIAPARHDDAARMGARSDDALYDTIDGGGGIMNRNVRMPAFGGTLSPPQIRALVRQIRTLCKCQGPKWSVDGAEMLE
jgi:mono/diheme cytochrome c family protein